MIPNEQKPFVTNAADESQVKAAGHKERRHREIQISDMKQVLSTVEGRRFIWELLSFCRIFESSYNGQFGTIYNEGHRNVGLKILADVNDADPGAYTKMLTESRRRNV
jgi:hypothetical protein